MIRSRRWRARLDRALGLACRAAIGLAAALLASLVAVTFAQVVLGWLGRSTPLWISQWSRAAFTGLVFLSIGPGLRENAHLAIEAVVARLPERWQRGFDRLVSALLLAVLVRITLSGVRIVGDDWTVRLPQTRWPQSVYSALIPIGAGLAALVALERLLVGRRPTAAPTGVGEVA